MLKTAPFSTRPLYLQVRDLLVARIVAGEWKPRGTLPNEVDLARELSVSPGTVRRALEEMESERLIYRRQGRGTFVADHTSEELAIRYTNIRTSKGVRLAGEIGGAELSTGEADELEQKRLRLRPGSGVTRIQRIKQSGNVPFMVVRGAAPSPFSWFERLAGGATPHHAAGAAVQSVAGARRGAGAGGRG